MARIIVGNRLFVRNIGGSTLFNGTTSTIDCGSSIVSAGVRTLSAWIFAKSWGEASFGRIFDNGKIKITVNSTDNPKNSINFSANGTTNAYSAYNSIKLNRWIHVIVTWTADGVGNCYINGILSGTANQAVGTPATGTTNLFIGNRSAGDRAFFGNIAEAKIFNSVLTASQALKLYITGSVSGVTPVASYALNDTPPTYIDSIAGNNGTGTDTTLSTAVPVKSRSVASNRINLDAQYIPNPYMDDDAGSGLPAGWSGYNNDDGDTISTASIDRTDFVTGSGSHKLTIFDPTTTYKNKWSVINLLSIFPSGFIRTGRNVRVFIRYKTTPGTYVFIGFSDGSAAKKVLESAPTVWTEVTTDIVFAKPKNSSFDLQIKCKNTNTTQVATLWIDEIRITHIPRTAV